MKFLLLTFAVVVLVGFANAEFDKKECKKVVATVVKKQLATITECINTMEFKNRKERAAKLPCILKCTGIKDKLIAENGLITKETIDVYVQALPPFLHERTTTMFSGCLAMINGENSVDPEEEYCRSYTPFIKCFLDGTTKLCEEPKDPKTPKPVTKSK